MAKNRRIVTPEEIKQAEERNIQEVALSLGIELQEFPKYWQNVQHPSMRFYKETNHFNWFSEAKGGNGIVLVRTLTDKTFVEAVDYLNGADLTQVETVVKEITPDPFHYYFKHADTFEIARNYLINDRQIQPSLVDALHKKGFLQQDKFDQVIFPWGKSGQIVGADVQGTVFDQERFGERGRFKGIASHSESSFGYNISLGNPTKLLIFESPIDLLSYWSLNMELKDTMLASISGVKEEAVMSFINYMYVAKDSLPTEGVSIAADNDKQGQRLWQKFENRVYEIKQEQPEKSELERLCSDYVELAIKEEQELIKVRSELGEEIHPLTWQRAAFLTDYKDIMIQELAESLTSEPVELEEFLNGHPDDSDTRDFRRMQLATFTLYEFVEKYTEQVWELDYVLKETPQLKVDEPTAEIHFHSLIPDNQSIPSDLIALYQEVITNADSSVDWRLIASIHKLETNLSLTNEITNLEDYGKYFGEKLPYGERPTPLSIEETRKGIGQLVTDFDSLTGSTEERLGKLLKHDGYTPIELELITKRVIDFYEVYTQQGYKPVKAVLKDWNDVLIERNVYAIDAQLLENIYENAANKQELSIEKENGKYKAKIERQGDVIGFFEVDTPEEMEKMIAAYGFVSVDKEDRKTLGVSSEKNNTASPKNEVERSR